MVKHIVMFKFKDENKENNILKAKKILNKLEDLVPTLLSIEVGIDFSKEDRAMDLSIITTFNNKSDLNEYAIHPEHIKVVNFIKEVIVQSKVVDYES